MGFYLIVIAGSMAVTALANIIAAPFTTELSVLYICISVVIDTVAVIAVDGVFAWLIRRMPEKLFSYGVRCFDVSESECAFYNKLGIRKWRHLVPELGMFTNFSKSKIASPKDNDYLKRFVLESNYGVVIHIFNAVTGFVIIFIHPLRYALCFGIPLGFANFLLSLLPVFLLRYNTPKLAALIRKNERTQASA